MTNEMTKHGRAILYAYQKGYRVRIDGVVISPSGRMRKLSRDCNGRLRFNVKPDLVSHSFPIRVASLAAYQKFGECIFSKDIEVRHLDGDCCNNAYENIAIGSHQENMLDIPKEKRRKYAICAGRHRSNLTQSDVKHIRYMREKEGKSYREIMDMYKVAKSTLSLICNYKTWKDEI